MIYTVEQINTALQLLNGLQVSGIENCSRVSEITRILQNPAPEKTVETVQNDTEDTAE